MFPPKTKNLTKTITVSDEDNHDKKRRKEIKKTHNEKQVRECKLRINENWNTNFRKKIQEGPTL